MKLKLEDDGELYEEDVPIVYNLTVEDGPEVEDTGLVDASGEPIYRLVRLPIGFTAVW